MTATFGDIIRAAREDLDAVTLDLREATAGDMHAAVSGLYRLVAAMSRCAGDLVPYTDIDVVVGRPTVVRAVTVDLP